MAMAGTATGMAAGEERVSREASSVTRAAGPETQAAASVAREIMGG